ncbi:S10 family peptidase [Pseudidiomarina terrestris]|uniref:Carboxypeptidase n=1 Tax=Pseudidiomarina terrestris TaxID=2820060 RepID=A0AAW7R371_9GAMM|nr:MULTISPECIES: carboxypeptidase [unclassified Pseudidiomarina]MDN7125095.1 carboxypeptidase [Pseudidiomarina sp. 1APP75-32.1]MDN7127502.1 carboxypeptidase [Pseudidiomarina sp. 1APR75-33.1]MDN7129855.1 carboxypeptidase [Pseudidiomarina sp. 1APR75-15]MDN7136014.1 carboxypeptidase [Pseudidiomarina sp. 1ASP75-5]MDN7138453.1 carboxypeptidase [Pseudidiomarina sp. 1ASP75-14]
MNVLSRAISASCVTAALLLSPLSLADDHGAPVAKIAADDVVVTNHRASINGERFEYTATTGTQPVFNDEGEATAALFFTYYERQDVKNREERPLLISFNGGPGSASVWMHIAYTGPKSLRVDDEGFPIMPYGVKDNPHSVLDVADIVFVNPVNTGYSRVLPNAEGEMPSKSEQQKMFFGVNADVDYLADWVNTFVTRHERWRSPKYLIGESYGTTRVSGLALALQNRQWMYLNGVILVSPTEIGIDRLGPVEAANRLPYFAATAWYHDALNQDLQSKDLMEVLDEVEAYTLNTYLPALAKGAMLPAAEREQVAEQVARFSGLSKQTVLRANLDINPRFFWKELLRDRGQTVGRLDSRYLGIDRDDVGASPDYNAELTSWLHSFTPAINYYLREELNYKTDVKYNMFGPVHPWDRSNNNTGENLRQAMAQNPYLNVLVQSGYYDGATNYFDAKYTTWHLDPSGRMADRIDFKGYRSGHMMYLRAEDLKSANSDVRTFIESTVPAKGEAAKYEAKQ